MTSRAIPLSQDRTAYCATFIDLLRTVVGKLFDTNEFPNGDLPDFLGTPTETLTPRIYLPSDQFKGASAGFDLKLKPIEAVYYFMHFASHLRIGEMFAEGAKSRDSVQIRGKHGNLLGLVPPGSGVDEFRRHEKIVRTLMELKKLQWNNELCEALANKLAD